MSSPEKTTQMDGKDPSENNGSKGAPLQAALEKISGAAAPAANYIATGAHLAGDALVAAAVKTNSALGAAGEQLNEIQERVAEDCRKYVRAKPITAIGIAVAVGFLLNAWLGRSDKA